MIRHTLADGRGSQREAGVNEDNELLVNAKSTPVDYEPTAVPWVNQVGRVRIADVQSKFEGRFFYGLNNEFWQTAANVNGTRTYLPDSNGVSLNIPGASGDKYYDITKTIFYYQPDSVVHAATALSFDSKKNLTEFWGLVSYIGGQINDGYLLRNRSGQMEFVKISSVSGTPVEIAHPRALWRDPMDGTGPSGLSLDFDSIQMAKIDHAWYGAGSANLSFRVGNKTYLADTFLGANTNIKQPIIANPNLAIMYGIEAEGTVSSPSSFPHYGLSVGSDGGLTPTGLPYGVASGNKTATGGLWTPILSIRLKSSFSIDGATAKPNVFGFVSNLLASIFVGGRNAEVALVKNATLTGAGFGNIPDVVGTGITNSMIEFDNSATAITAGTIIYPRTLPGDAYTEISVADQDVLAVDSLGQGSETLTIVARPSAGGNASVNASFAWREVY